MPAELANLNQCAVPFLSGAVVNLSWYDYNIYIFVGREMIFEFASKPRIAFDAKTKTFWCAIANKNSLFAITADARGLHS